jgi:hypothetical protein
LAYEKNQQHKEYLAVYYSNTCLLSRNIIGKRFYGHPVILLLLAVERPSTSSNNTFNNKILHIKNIGAFGACTIHRRPEGRPFRAKLGKGLMAFTITNITPPEGGVKIFVKEY